MANGYGYHDSNIESKTRPKTQNSSKSYRMKSRKAIATQRNGVDAVSGVQLFRDDIATVSSRISITPLLLATTKHIPEPSLA